MTRLVQSIAIVVILALATRASADDTTREAGRHFQRGVELYNDGDFRGALVEFKKAYGMWPRASVLYDIGQTQYQILDYAAALKTMERFLAETGPNAAHRAEVESTVEVLRGRVGNVALTTDPDCDVSVDEQAAGTTPLGQSILVSVGPHKIAVACAGRPLAQRHVEVAAGETVRLELRPPAAPPPALRALATTTPVADAHRHNRQGLFVAWTVTSILALSTIAIGSAALIEADKLGTLKQTFPVTRGALNNQASLTSGLSITADALGAATLAAIGVSTYLTVRYTKERSVRAALTPGGVSVSGSF